VNIEGQTSFASTLQRGVRGAEVLVPSAARWFARSHRATDEFEHRAPAAAAAAGAAAEAVNGAMQPPMTTVLQRPQRLNPRAIQDLCMGAVMVPMGARIVLYLCEVLGPLPLPAHSQSCSRLGTGPLFGTVVGVVLAAGLRSQAQAAGQGRAGAASTAVWDLLDGWAVSGTLAYRLGLGIVHSEPVGAALRTGLCELGIRNAVFGMNPLAQGRFTDSTPCVVGTCALDLLGTCITGAIVGLLPDYLLFRGLGLSLLLIGANSFYTKTLYQWQQSTDTENLGSIS
jgi:hypothetical protein